MRGNEDEIQTHEEAQEMEELELCGNRDLHNHGTHHSEGGCKLKIKEFVQILAALLVVAVPAHAAQINMLEEDGLESEIAESVTFGVDIEGMYYSVVVEDGRLIKLELNGTEETKFVIHTDWQTLTDFVADYNTMSWMQKIQFLIVRMNIPIKYILRFDDLVTV